MFFSCFFFASSGDSSCRFFFGDSVFVFLFVLLKSTFSVLHGVINVVVVAIVVAVLVLAVE